VLWQRPDFDVTSRSKEVASLFIGTKVAGAALQVFA